MSNGCGVCHGVSTKGSRHEFVPIPERDGWCLLIPCSANRGEEDRTAEHDRLKPAGRHQTGWTSQVVRSFGRSLDQRTNSGWGSIPLGITPQQTSSARTSTINSDGCLRAIRTA